jgi:hypothetical protein
MKKGTIIYIAWILIISLAACNNDDVNTFDKTADERTAEAIANLKQELIAPANGWKVKYTPVLGYGSYYVLMKFTDDNKVRIRTDLSANSGEFFDKTIGFRVDSSLGLELILENYSFFSYLLEQDDAQFGAEFEFLYSTKKADGSLLFKSKTDAGDPTTLLFEEATPTDFTFPGTSISANITTLVETFDKYSTTLKITYVNKDLILYLRLDDVVRTVTITAASKKTDEQNFQLIDFSSPYVFKGDSIIFDGLLKGSYVGNSITLKSIKLNNLIDTQITPCVDPLPIKAYNGITSANDNVTLEATLTNHDEALFKTGSEIYLADLFRIRDENNESVAEQVADDITGAIYMLIYTDNPNTELSNAVGFFIENSDGTFTIAARNFTPTFIGNRIEFAFDSDITVLRNTNTDANVNNIDIYLNKMTEGGKTYVYQLNDFLYEVYNPCNGWKFIFQVLN